MYGPLADAMVTLAGTPDYSPSVNSLMVSIVKLAAERVAPVSHASVTALSGKAYITVAVSDDLIKEVDEVQYADNAGPCLEALDTGAPSGSPTSTPPSDGPASTRRRLGWDCTHRSRCRCTPAEAKPSPSSTCTGTTALPWRH